MAESPDDIAESSADDTGEENEANEDKESQEKEILEEAKARFKLADEAWAEIRRQALDDIKFSAGLQWPENIRSDRELEGRPCLVINRLPQFIQQITNDQRQNRPSIKVHPIDDDADIETAKVIQGLIRHIEYNSNADTAYDTAFESAVKGGFGFLRIITDFAEPDSFDQEILFKRIRNPFSVSLDPSSSEPDGSDANWALITEDLTREEYKRAYPDSRLADKAEWDSIGNDAEGWLDKGSARVAEYFYKDYKTVKILQLSDGKTVQEDELEEYAQEFAAKNSQQLPDGSVVMSAELTVIRERDAKIPVIKWCKINGIEILEETDWPGKYIPIIPVYGNEVFYEGQRILEGIVRNAKDPQRMYNYWKSAETEAIALAPRAPFIIEEGQIEGYEADWETANRRNHSALKYKATSINGSPVPPPQRQSFEPAVQAITQAGMYAADDLKATTGIYDPSLGAQKPDQSGIAIQRLNQQSQTSNFHFVDNMTRSLRHAGRVLIDLIPKIYDTERAVRIIGDGDEQSIVHVNATQAQKGQVGKDGKPLLYQLDAGRYDVTVDVGPSYASKRQEAVASMLSLAQSFPQLAQVAGDLVVKNMDWPGATEIADRIKKTLPPNLVDDGKKDQPLPPMVQAQMGQMNQMIEQLTQQLHVEKDKNDKKLPEIESKERIEMAKLQMEGELALAKLGSQESLALLGHQISEIEGRLQNVLHFMAPLQGVEQQEPAPDSAGGQPAPGGQGMQPHPGLGAPHGSPMQMPTGGQMPPGSPGEQV